MKKFTLHLKELVGNWIESRFLHQDLCVSGSLQVNAPDYNLFIFFVEFLDSKIAYVKTSGNEVLQVLLEML